ncbi:hypothetical protein J4Q44_G00093770 [Coregonus suidteri]|uniref:Uncharacterized protein n=1 Tax=Coregonus suidteri TaxID=861788 RepID=A0AAN8QXE8_9TELE
MRRALVLRALPVYLREDASKFFRTCNSADGPDLTDTPVALLTVVTDDTTDAALFSPESICIVVEDEILCVSAATMDASHHSCTHSLLPARRVNPTNIYSRQPPAENLLLKPLHRGPGNRTRRKK